MEKVKKKKSSRMLFLVQLAIAVILIATMSIYLVPIGRSDRGGSAAPNFPPWLGGLKIQNYITGNDAKKQMEITIPGETASLRDAWLALYDENAVVWIGQASSESEAERLLKLIVEKTQLAIASHAELKLQPSSKKGMTVYIIRVNDQDREYIYEKGDKVFWVTPPSGKAESFLNEVLDNIN